MTPECCGTKHRLWREVGKSEDKQKSSVTQSREQDMRWEEAGTTTGCAFLPCSVRLAVPSKRAFLCGKNTLWPQAVLK